MTNFAGWALGVVVGGAIGYYLAGLVIRMQENRLSKRDTDREAR